MVEERAVLSVRAQLLGVDVELFQRGQHYVVERNWGGRAGVSNVFLPLQCLLGCWHRLGDAGLCAFEIVGNGVLENGEEDEDSRHPKHINDPSWFRGAWQRRCDSARYARDSEVCNEDDCHTGRHGTAFDEEGGPRDADDEDRRKHGILHDEPRAAGQVDVVVDKGTGCRTVTAHA